MNNNKNNNEEYYQILNIPVTTSQKDIYKAYLKLTRFYYCEKGIFRVVESKYSDEEIKKAYEMLRNKY